MVIPGVRSSTDPDTSEMTLTAHKATTFTAEQPGTGYASRESETKVLKAGTQALQAGSLALLAPMAVIQPTAETVRQLIKDELQEGIRGSFKEVSESINALKESVESIQGGGLAETRQVDVHRLRMSMSVKPMEKGTQWGDVKLSGDSDVKIRWKTQWDDGKPKTNSVDIVSVKKISEMPIQESDQEVLNSWNKAAVAAMQTDFGTLEVKPDSVTLPCLLPCLHSYVLACLHRCMRCYVHSHTDNSALSDRL